jgi:hypothetical protein
MAAFGCRVLLSRPTAFGQLLPKPDADFESENALQASQMQRMTIEID